MSPPPTDPFEPREMSRRELQRSVVWGVFALAFAGFAFFKYAQPETEKKNFYLFTGGIAVLYAVVTVVSAWRIFQKWNKPPTAPK